MPTLIGISVQKTGLLIASIVMFSNLRGNSSSFEELGTPVKMAALMAAVVAKDSAGKHDIVYLSCAQTASDLLLLAVDPNSGKTTSYSSNSGPGAWAIEEGSDGSIYLGTWNGGYLLRFDPRQPQKGIVKIGNPCPGESYIWALANGADGKLYGTTYPHAKLFSYDPRTGRTVNFGSMDNTQKYARSIACSPDGNVYIGIGYGRANIVVFDPKTEEHHSILPERFKTNVIASVQEAKDKVYAKAGKQWFEIKGESLTPITDAQVAASPQLTMSTGEIIDTANLPTAADSIKIISADGKKNRTLRLTYNGKGSRIFVVASGPDQKIYGSSYIPLQLFSYDPQNKATNVLGNPVPIDGQLYSMLSWQDRLYMAAYQLGAYVSVYDPKLPFKFGTEDGANPRGLGNLGPGHMRPRAMIAGPQDKIYIGSQPPYGEVGGSMAVLDPQSNQVTANFRNVVQNQGIDSLAYDPRSGLIFGGSDTAGGGGVVTKEHSAHIFGWDPSQGQKIIDIIPVANDTAITAMAAANGQIFAVSVPSNTLTIYSARRKKIIAQKRILFGGVHEVSLGLHPNGLLYALAGNNIITIDPRTYQINRLAAYGGKITCGFALTREAVYFGSNAQLVRYRIPNSSMASAHRRAE